MADDTAALRARSSGGTFCIVPYCHPDFAWTHHREWHEERYAVSLCEAPANRRMTVVRLEEESPEVVQYLTERKLLPGRRVRIERREPLGGGVVLDVEGEELTLGHGMAATIRVKPSRRGS